LGKKLEKWRERFWWGLSFPGQSGSSRPKKLVHYVVNTRYWQQEYGVEIEDEDDLGEGA